MKNSTRFLVELSFTILLAGIFSALLAFVLTFIFANLNVFKDASPYIDAATYILFGFIVGFKLKVLLAEHAKPTKKKK